MRHIIIGDGATGTTAAHYIRSADHSASITIVSDDPNPAYYRAALTNYLLGELQESQLFAVPPDFYIENEIDRILARVASVDSAKNLVALADGRQIEYDQLLIASGSRPNTPTFPGAEIPGVMTMRTLQDVRTVVDGIRSGRVKRAVVVGGGPLGIEWVQGLMHYKVHVTYLLRGEMFFERALDKTGSDLVISRLRAEGVDVRTNEEIAEALAGRDGRLHSIRLKNSKETIDCQLAGTAIGIRPNIKFLETSGIEIAKDEKRGTLLGVTVDKHMRTNLPNVYAGGDVIHRTLGLWEPARLQGRIAGRNMTGGSETFNPGEHYFATRLYDLDFASLGSINDKPGDGVLVDFPRGSGRIAYRKLILRDNKLVGALMLGQRKENVRKFGLYYKKLIEAKTDVSPVADRMSDPSFDLASWMDSLDMGSKIEAVRSIIATSSLPTPAAVLTSELKHATNTFAVQPLKAPQAFLRKGGQVFTIVTSLSIGRKPENQVVINEPLVSGKHAVIEKRGLAYVITDNNSTNGTFVNDAPIAAPYILKDGDAIQIGNSGLLFEMRSEDQGSKTSSMPEEISIIQPKPGTVLGTIELNGKRFEIKNETITLGRDPNAAILIEDPTVSYMHAEIAFHNNRHYLRDLGSRNGTFVNENLVVTSCVLKDNDSIRLGSVRMKFNTNAATKSAVPVTPPKQVKTEFIVSQKMEQDHGRLIVYSGPTIGLSFNLKPPSMTVGRDTESNDIALQSQTVSRRHARLAWHDGNWHVTDLKSGNGTRINGRELKPEVETSLAPRDEIHFGEVKLVYESSAATAEPIRNLPVTFLLDPEGAEESAAPTPPNPEPIPRVSQPEADVVQVMESPLAKEETEEKPASLPLQVEASAQEAALVEKPTPGGASDEATQFVQSTFPTHLTALAGPAHGRTILLVNLPLTIGRNATNEVQGLDDPLVSRRHLRITLSADGNIGVNDLGSVNGTFLNGIALEPNRVFLLKKGDELRLGSTVLKAG